VSLITREGTAMGAEVGVEERSSLPSPPPPAQASPLPLLPHPPPRDLRPMLTLSTPLMPCGMSETCGA